MQETTMNTQEGFSRLVELPGYENALHGIGAGASGPKRKSRNICVSEKLKIAVVEVCERFLEADPLEYGEMEFPTSLSATERAYIHRYADGLGLVSRSRGKKNNRQLMVRRKALLTTDHRSGFDLTSNSLQVIRDLIHKHPLTDKERFALLPRSNPHMPDTLPEDGVQIIPSKLNFGLPQVPPSRSKSSVELPDLPVLYQASEISQAITANPVILVSGETGCGKTTQVPQIILDECSTLGMPCRMFCSQPRRISAVSVAERVAKERGEQIGQIIGYQIRLESRVSPKTLLTFCTNGVLLRTLMAGEDSMATVTHVFVDEVHERDKLCDFLLISLRMALARYPNLKVILMSATLNSELFSHYFGGCPVITVPGSLYEVERHYLKDVLKYTGYCSGRMSKRRDKLIQMAQARRQMGPNVSEQKPSTTGQTVSKIPVTKAAMDTSDSEDDITPELMEKMDSLLVDVWMNGNESALTEMYELIVNQGVSADYQHSETGVTPLMAACAQGLAYAAEHLIKLGANVPKRAIQAGVTALSIALQFHHNDCVQLLQTYGSEDVDMDAETDSSLSEEDRILLESYQSSFDDSMVDLDLILALIGKIMDDSKEGAILVFLPGYSDIVSLRELIECSTLNSARFKVYMLHSRMQTNDQRQIFKRSSHGSRKIILSTNIAETSVTIPDVVFVIDSARVKVKALDALTGISSLDSTWVSQANCKQRSGRAGRCQHGVCYHLISRARFNTLPQYQVAEICRTPLQELCLQTKLLAPIGTSIADFLSQAPEAPSQLVLNNAINLLKQIDCLDASECLTELGRFLVNLPIEPRLGKMILYSLILKCLDPVLTIACTLSYRDPFQMPAQAHQKREATRSRNQFAAGSLSDHIVLLKAFQAWQTARSENYEQSFCTSNFISRATLDMILGMRGQLLGHLRAIGFVKTRGSGDVHDLNTNSDSWPAVKAALCAGLYPNLVKVNRTRNTLFSQRETNIQFHTSSIVSPSASFSNPKQNRSFVESLPTDWLLYDEMHRSAPSAGGSTCNIRGVTAISPVTVALFAGTMRLPVDKIQEIETYRDTPTNDDMAVSGQASSDSDAEDTPPETSKLLALNLDGWINLQLEPCTARLLLQLRQKWNNMLLRRLSNLSKLPTQTDEAVVKAVVEVLVSEEETSSLEQPAGVGQRPTHTTVRAGNLKFSRYPGTQSSDSSPPPSRANRVPPSHVADRKSHGPMRGAAQRGDKRRANRTHQYSDKQADSSSPKSSSSTTGSRPSSAANSPCDSPALPVGPRSSPGSAPLGDLRSRLGPPRPSLRYSGHFCHLVVKCTSYQQIETSVRRGIWCAGPEASSIFDQLILNDMVALLLITVHGSNQFDGIARLVGQASQKRLGEFQAPQPVSCSQLAGITRVINPTQQKRLAEFQAPQLTGCYHVSWIKRANVPYQPIQQILAAHGDHRAVNLNQPMEYLELDPRTGAAIVQLWDRVPFCNQTH